MAQHSPGRVCGAPRTPCLPAAGTPGTDRCYAIWCEAESTAWADRAFWAKPSDVFSQGLPRHPTDKHQAITRQLTARYGGSHLWSQTPALRMTRPEPKCKFRASLMYTVCQAATETPSQKYKTTTTTPKSKPCWEPIDLMNNKRKILGGESCICTKDVYVPFLL